MVSVLQITPCGHVYSFSSIMQHLMAHGGEQLRRSGPCPLCYQPVVARELRLVQVRSSQTHSRRTPLGMPGGEDSWCAAQWWQHWCQRPGSCDSTAVSWCCIMVRATDMVLSAGPLGCSARGSVSPGARQSWSRLSAVNTATQLYGAWIHVQVRQVAVPAVGSTVTFQLLRRPKGSIIPIPVTATVAGAAGDNTNSDAPKAAVSGSMVSKWGSSSSSSSMLLP